MEDNREFLKTYLKGRVINNLQDFVDTLNYISPLIDGWSVAKPLSCKRMLLISERHNRRKAYVQFSIPKKSGGERVISAPTGILKQIQGALNVLLQSLFTPSEYATGFVAGRSIRNNAELHKGQHCIYTTDLENFFPSITKNMLGKALHREFSEKITCNQVIGLICDLCTMPDADRGEVLPQGASTSPVLSNIVLNSFDKEVAALAGKIGCKYSRYADDITFSHNKEIRRMAPDWIAEIIRIVERHGLKINHSKTKTLVPGERMEVTGVVISNKINVPRQFIRQLRTLLHLWEKYGYVRANQIFIQDFCQNTIKDLCNVIKGKINYIEMIKGRSDSTVQIYRHRLNSLLWKENFYNKSQGF